MRLRLELFGIATVFTAAMACSSSSSPPAATGAGSDASDSDAGGSADTGAVGEPSDGAVATATTITCGGAMCSAPSGTMFPLSPCCLADNGCGASFGAGPGGAGLGGGTSDAGALCIDVSPGTPDTTCPSQTAMGIALTGCCTKSKICGVDLSVAGLGCNSLSALAALAPGGAGGDAAPAQGCGPGVDSGAPDGSPAGDGGH